MQHNESLFEQQILIVDDVPENLQVLANILQKRHYEVNMASSGEDALVMAGEIKPDLILLDIQMPEMDGFEVCRRLKSEPATEAIPVIFLTAHTDIENIVKGLNAGAVDYVTKPFNAAELTARIRTHLELKHNRELIEEQNRKLIELNRDKDEFLGIAAHDLINPLNAITGFCTIIDRQKDRPDMISEYTAYIVMAAKRMHGIVKNLLDIHKIEQGKIENKPEHIDLSMTLMALIENNRVNADRKDIAIKLSNEIPGSTVFIDPFIIGQVMDNLLSNAIKFSPGGREVYVDVRKTETLLCLEVSDQGPGITEEDRQQLFGKFARLSAQPTAGENSTGLGLSIVKMLVDSAGGTIGVQSTPGKGATFRVELPLKSQ